MIQSNESTRFSLELYNKILAQSYTISPVEKCVARLNIYLTLFEIKIL